MPATRVLSGFLLTAITVLAQNTPRVNADFGRIPLYFEENRGQTDQRARFLAKGGGATGFITTDGLTFSDVTMRIAGANPKPVFTPETPAAGISNYYIGKLAITALPHYAIVRAHDVLPGIDVIYHGSGYELEYDLVIRPGADPGALRLQFEGGETPVLSEDGDVVVKTRAGELRQHQPNVWQEIGGKRTAINCRYALSDTGEVRLVLAKYRRTAELVIDPVLVYSTYFGGSGTDSIGGIAADSNGSAYVVGYTSSTDFPATSGSVPAFYGAKIFIAKLNASATALVYSTIIGGQSQDTGKAIAVDSAGNAYITGTTTSTTFPFTNNIFVSGNDAFVIKVGPTGTLLYSTAVTGGNDSGVAIAVDASGSAYVAGSTGSNTFPATANSLQPTLRAIPDAFVAKLTPSGTISYATYLGGNGNDSPTAIALDAAGNAFVGGSTSSTNFPTTAGAYRTTSPGAGDGFIAKLNATGSTLLYSTYLGGSQSDSIAGLAIDSAGNCYVAGSTQSPDFPTTPGAFSSSKGSSYTYSTIAFVTKLNSSGSGLVYSSFLGGSNTDSASGIAVDSSGVAYVTGTASSVDFPTTPGALQMHVPATSCCGADLFLVKLASDGSVLNYSTMLGPGSESSAGLALDGNGYAYLAGGSTSPAFPTTSGAFQASKPSSYNSPVVVKIDINSTATCISSVFPTSQNLPGRGGTFSFQLTLSPGCPWQATSDSLITLTPPTSGVVSSSPTLISGSVPVNNSTTTGQTGAVRIGAATFTVNQAPGSCLDPVFSPSSITFDSSGGIHTFRLTLPSGCGWVATSNAGWLSVSTNATGFGSTTISVFADQNSFSTRTATVTVAGQTVGITQTGSNCTANVSGTPSTFVALGGTGTAQIIPSSGTCVWAAYSDVPWIHVAANASPGTGNGSIPFQIASNPTPASRMGHILIADQMLTINQSAGPGGTINGYSTTVFAGGMYTSSPSRGDGGPAIASYLINPTGLATDPISGNVYIGDSDRIRVVTPDGLINTIAGGGSDTSENIAPLTALLSSPVSLAVDSASAVYLSDSATRVRKVSQGNINTVAGTLNYGFSGDNGPATAAKLSGPYGLAADSSNNLFISDSSNNRVREIASGTITTFAGSGNSALGDGGPAASANLANPQGLAFDTTGNLYIADRANGRIRKVSQGVISTIAGGGAGGDGGPATSASLNSPTGIAIDPLGNILFIDNNLGRLRKIAPDGTLTTIATSCSPACFSAQGIATDSSANVYFSSGVYVTEVFKLTPLPSFCSFTVSTPSPTSVTGGPLSITVTAAANCNWTAESDLPWVTLTSGATGSGNGAVQFTVAPLAGSAPRTGTISVAGQAIQITQLSATSLSITKVHVANFTQGQQNVTYSLTVSNATLATPSSGTVTVTDTLPSGLSLVSIAGTGWTCSSTTCTRSDALAGGTSYPPITVTVNVAANATSPQLNQASVSGGGSPTANASDSTTIAVFVPPSSLQVTQTDSGNFQQGLNGSTSFGPKYVVTISNAAGAGSTVGGVTVTDTLPTGLTLASSTALSGTGWNCIGNICSRGDSLAPGSSYPPITVPVNVSFNAPASGVNLVVATGGGSPAATSNHPTSILPNLAHLSISKTHAGNFTAGQQNATYTVTVGNLTGTGFTNGTVTVTEMPPSGLTIVSMAGTGWTCTTSVCTTNTSLPLLQSYPPITVTVNVSPNASTPQVNQVMVSGGGSPSATASDSTVINGAIQTLFVNRTLLNFAASTSGIFTSAQSVAVSFSGGNSLAWTAASNQPNIVVIGGSGTGNGSFQVAGNVGANGTVTVTSPGALGSPAQIQVNISNPAPGKPFGAFETPANNTTGVSGAIAVSGWALDSVEVSKVSIWREPVGTEAPTANGLIYIGDAAFVADARPDVQAANPNIPLNYRAGWGYLMLTNFLPAGGGSTVQGNGTYNLHAIAQNKAGVTTDLGTRTITVDNAHATKPFGTIDTPGQGGTVSGNNFVNFGWALTQNPNVIPTDGSTITVTVDGVTLGHPTYNQFRADIANAFPGLANSSGAVGYFYIDTTQLANGSHTIAWIVYDDHGRGDGIGSRYFNVQNTSSGSFAAPDAPPFVEGVKLRRGFDRREPQPLKADDTSTYLIDVPELERVELHTGAVTGYLLVNGEHHALPTGSTLRGGVFYWQLAPGFLGDYKIILTKPNGSDVPLRIRVQPGNTVR